MKPFPSPFTFRHLAGKRLFFLLVAFAVIAMMACSTTESVRVDPKVKLDGYQSIGIIGFSGNSKDRIEPLVTQKFMQSLQSAQPNVIILELGTENELLKEMRLKRLDPHSIRKIGKKYQIDALFSGNLLVSEVKPSFKISSSLRKSLNAKAYIEGTLNTRLWVTNNGATRWTRSTTGKKSVASINLSDAGPASFGAEDPEAKYGELITNLVKNNTYDFYPRYVTRKVKK